MSFLHASKLQETEFQEDVKLEEQDKEHKDESQGTNNDVDNSILGFLFMN